MVKKRLRKKKRLGEFRQDGFHVVGKLKTTSDADYEKFLDDFIDFVEREPVSLLIGGGSSKDSFGFFVTAQNRTCSSADQDDVVRYMKSSPYVGAFVVGPLIDAWHGNAAEVDRIDDELKALVGVEPKGAT